MIKVSVLYPARPGARFDMDYYLSTHIGLVRDRLSPALKGVAIEVGLSGAEPGTEPTYAVMAHLNFDSIDAFGAAFGPHAEAIMGDVPNYTDIEPVVQISEIRV